MGHRRCPAPAPHSWKGRRARKESHPACVRTQQLALPGSRVLLIQYCHEITTHGRTGGAAQGSPSLSSVPARLQRDRAEPSLAQLPDTLPWKQPEPPAAGAQPPFSAGRWDSGVTGLPSTATAATVLSTPGPGPCHGRSLCHRRSVSLALPRRAAAVPSARSQGTLCSLRVFD